MDFSRIAEQIDKLTKLQDGWLDGEGFAPPLKVLENAEDFIQGTFYYEHMLPERWLKEVYLYPLIDASRGGVEVDIPLSPRTYVNLNIFEDVTEVMVNIPVDDNFRKDHIYEFTVQTCWFSSEAIRAFWEAIRESIFETNPLLGLYIWDPEEGRISLM